MNIKDKLKQGTVAEPKVPEIDEKNYYIHPKLQKDLDALITTMTNIEDFGTEMGNRNYILSGPPGVGKTLGVKYIANQVGMVIYDGKDLTTAEQISAFFSSLREESRDEPVILQIDEIDKFASRDQVVDPTQQQALNQLLTELDGSESNNNIFIFGTTNRPNDIDPALRRTKRFSKEIEFIPPDQAGRYKILQMHAQGKGGHKFEVKDEDLVEASKVTFGYTGADLVGLLNEAFVSAKLEDRLEVNQGDFEYALQKTTPSALKDMPFVEPKTNFDILAGYDDHEELLKRIVEHSDGSTALFYGPKGTGKSAYAEALAGEYGYNLIVVSGSAPQSKWVGETGKTLEKYLDRAKQLAPCILLFDEMDSLVGSGMGHQKDHTGMLQAKLSKPIPGVYVIATMNEPQYLKGPFVDRFVHKLYFGKPDDHDRLEIWKAYLPDGIDAQKVSDANTNVSCRDIARTKQLISDYGVEPTTDIYCSLASQIKDKQEYDYSKVIADIGDSVDDYRRIKACTQGKPYISKHQEKEEIEIAETIEKVVEKEEKHKPKAIILN